MEQKIFLSKYLIFDFGGTLADYKGLPSAWADFYPEAFEFAGRKLGCRFGENRILLAAEILKKYNARFYPRIQEISDSVIFEEVRVALELQVSAKELAGTFYEFFQEKLVVYEETKTVLEALRKHEYKFGVLSDLPTGMPHESFLEDLGKIGFDFVPEFVQSSMSAGFRKPYPEGVKVIARQMGCEPEEICFIGDEKKDIEIIKQLGGKSVLVNRKNRPNIDDFGADYIIENLRELL